MISIGHLSDLHTTPVHPERIRDLFNKRVTGWLSWRLRRRHAYLPRVLDALIDDLARTQPDHVVVTGDLTNVALPSEFRAARGVLDRLGAPDRVFVIPGNHDAYVRVAPERGLDLWRDYLASDAGEGPPEAPSAHPTLRRRGEVAIVGVDSACPTAWFLAQGAVGEAQRERVEALLGRLRDEGLCRVVLIHHPIVDGATSQRRALRDAAEFRAVLERAGAELVLHGHNHRTQIARVPGPDGPIPVVGVRSGSYLGEKEHKRARYHLYDFERNAAVGPRFRVRLRARGFDPATGAFGPVDEREL